MFTNSKHLFMKLFALTLIMVLLISCGLFGDSDDEIDSDQPPSDISSAPATKAIVSTPIPEVSPIEQVLSNLIQYEHPSGAFSIMVPDNIVSDEGDFSSYFRITDTADLVIAFEVFGRVYSDEELAGYTKDWLDSTMFDTNYAQSYEITQSETIDGMYVTYYDFIHESGDSGKGSLSIIQENDALFILEFTSFDFENDEPIRAGIFETLVLDADAAITVKASSIEISREPWRLEPYPGSQYIIDDTVSTPEWEDIVEYHATALSIPVPYSWDVYLLPDGTKFDLIKEHFLGVMQQKNYTQAMDKQWNNQVYTLTYLHSVNKNKKNAVIFMGEYEGRKPMAIIIYSNPE